MVPVNSFEYGTLAIEVGLVFNFAVVFPPSTDKLFGDWHVNRQGSPNRFLLLIIANRQIICLFLAEKEIYRKKTTAKFRNQTKLDRRCPKVTTSIFTFFIAHLI